MTIWRIALTVRDAQTGQIAAVSDYHTNALIEPEAVTDAERQELHLIVLEANTKMIAIMNRHTATEGWR